MSSSRRRSGGRLFRLLGESLPLERGVNLCRLKDVGEGKTGRLVNGEGGELDYDRGDEGKRGKSVSEEEALKE